MRPQLMSLKGHLAAGGSLVDLWWISGYLWIWGCDLIGGLRYYMPAGTSGDKPSYKKDGSGTGDDEVGPAVCRTQT